MRLFKGIIVHILIDYGTISLHHQHLPFSLVKMDSTSYENGTMCDSFNEENKLIRDEVEIDVRREEMCIKPLKQKRAPCSIGRRYNLF